MRLSELKTGEKGLIIKVLGRSAFRKRIIEMGFIRGKEVEVVQNAPLNDPIQYRIMGYDISLRRADAKLIVVVPENEYDICLEDVGKEQVAGTLPDEGDDCIARAFNRAGKRINIALVGNPNAGKTSLFNIASGAHEHVGNYGGVTVDAKEGVFRFKDYTFNIIDLPGTYSLSSYTPEERYVRQHIREKNTDVIVNVVDSSNLERNLYLTTQLIDMDAEAVVALNMYDSLQKSGDKLDYQALSMMLGLPMVPTVSRTGEGIEALFDKIIEVFEGKDTISRHIHINYGEPLEEGIHKIQSFLKDKEDIGLNRSRRYIAVKLLEKDDEMEKEVMSFEFSEQLLKLRDDAVEHAEEILNEDTETAFTNARYGFIAGALRETFDEKKIDEVTPTRIIDMVLTNKILGFPIFLLFMWIMFQGTFKLGDYPMRVIEWLVSALGDWAGNIMTDGPFKDLIVDGIIGGVGGVIVFLPNILILYLFISLMEDSGYMARAAFIMDKLMHKMGLHGKSFIPLIMGFGCNVPAIMATRTIESRNSRMVTMLVAPLMSCSARLPVYLLLVGAFFPGHSGLILFTIYTSGILLAVLMARIFKRYLFNDEDLPFVIELPPYRIPTLKSVLHHMWEKAKQYLRKMGGVILVASILIWFLGYFPRHTENTDSFVAQIESVEKSELTSEQKEREISEIERIMTMDQQENSFIGKIGHTIAPVMKPLGFDWKMSVSLVTGMAAKEVVVSTMGVLYSGDPEINENKLQDRLKQETDRQGNQVFTPLIALSFMFFVLIYFPCVATVTAVAKESGSWKWGMFLVLYSCVLAWVVSFLTFQIGSLFI